MSASRVVVALILSLGMAGPATAFRTPEGLTVRPLGPDRFAVPYRGESSARAFWCAAGTYARQVLGAGPTDRIWRETAVPRRSGQPMVFAMTPGASSGKTGLVMLGRDDGSLSVAMTVQFCNRRDLW